MILILFRHIAICLYNSQANKIGRSKFFWVFHKHGNLGRVILQPFENYARNLERHFGSVLIDQRGTFEHQSSTLNLHLENYSWFFYFGLSNMKSALLPYRPNRRPTFSRIIHCCQMVSIEKLLIKFLAMCWRMTILTISPWFALRKLKFQFKNVVLT